ncbi:MAG: MoaD/ThiS family protein [Chloroflexi bacterium]|nr:MoaD/ThiS family protein [Chloroflexota bacterium]
MKVQVLFAPPYNDAVGQRTVTVQLSEGAHVAGLLDLLVEMFPPLRQALTDALGRLLLGSEFFATVDDKVAKADQVLHEGSSVRLFPAIGGGARIESGRFTA